MKSETAPPVGSDEGRPHSTAHLSPRIDGASTVGQPVPHVTLRPGHLARVVIDDRTAAVCRTCGQRMSSRSGAASHARARRHQVNLEYAGRVTFVPADWLPWWQPKRWRVLRR